MSSFLLNEILWHIVAITQITLTGFALPMLGGISEYCAEPLAAHIATSNSERRGKLENECDKVRVVLVSSSLYLHKVEEGRVESGRSVASFLMV